VNPIIVLEGPDGVGKTTLGQALAKRLDGHYIHLHYRFPKAMWHYHVAAFEWALRIAEDRPVIIDRWWASELVYAAAFRGGSPWPMMGRMLDRAALKHGVTYVLCQPEDKEAYLDHYHHVKAADEDVLGSRAVVYDRYLDWKARMAGRKDFMTYDMLVEGLRLNSVIDMIVQRSIFQASVPSHFADRLDRRYAGNPQATILLVGDRAKRKTRRQMWPFFEHANSSLWVAQKLEEAGVDEYDLAWANAYDEDTGRVVIHPGEIVNEFRPIPLGGLATGALDMAGIPHGEGVHHPQYYRQFDPGTNPFLEILADYNKGEAYVEAGRNLCMA
jgi:DNA polymerase III delta prime subunit